MTKKFPLTLTLVIISFALWQCKPGYDINPEIEQEKLREHVTYLASEPLAGRYPATEGDSMAAKFIAQAFQHAGLTLLAQDGYQSFAVPQPAVFRVREDLSVTPSGKVLADTAAYQLYAIASSGAPAGKLHYCGYAHNAQMANKPKEAAWAVVLKTADKNLSAQAVRSLFIDAKNAGYTGAMVLHSEKDSTFAFSAHKVRGGEVGIVALEASPELSEKVLSMLHIAPGKTSATASTQAHLSENAVTMRVSRHNPQKSTQNVVAALVKDTTQPYVVIGAHYDHLGMGGANSGSRQPNTRAIHPGADDNASGVAALLELAEYLQFHKDSLEKNFLFVAFGAEEMGLLGSKHFVNHLPVPKEKIALMLNLDMLGRMKADSSLQIGGVGTFDYAQELVQKHNTDSLKLGISTEGYGPSDHASFYSASIPVLFFSTGAHLDYHTAADTAGALNYQRMAMGTRYIAAIAKDVAKTDSLYTFREAGPAQPKGPKHGERLKVTLGIMPDFSGVVKEGLRADVVIEGKPAHQAGMKKGDIIVALNSKPVHDIYEYMTLLADLKPGETVIVDVLRDKKKEVLLVQL
ncbi:MAG: M20/M25/M40 family metallo-hydrolase [Bacteroidales bacterium]